MKWSLVFLALTTPVYAQTVDVRANLGLSLPTQYTDGTVIPAGALTKVQLWARPSPIADTDANPTVVLPGPVTSYVYTGQVPNGSTLYFRHRVCTAAACSAMGPQISRSVKIDIPQVPSGITVTVTVTLSGP